MQILILFSLLLFSAVSQPRISSSRLQFCHHVMPRCAQSEFNCACEDSHSFILPKSECIPKSWVCDAWADCFNGADEQNCVCPIGMFQCNKCGRNESSCLPIYQCIPEDQVCDGVSNCANVRDEFGGQCEVDGFKCDNGIYIPSNGRCNGYYECPDRSDERGCEYNRCASNITSLGPCKIGECYADRERCDGYSHCFDYSDEMNCTLCPSYRPIPCACNQIDNFTCKRQGFTCYNDYEKCDGHPQCSDHSDEINCSSCNLVRPLRCECNQLGNYSCKGIGNVCYNRFEGCDGIPTCSDHSDERGCTTCRSYRPYRCACNQINNYTCSEHGHVCYNDFERCNGRTDCADSSDELNCMCRDDLFTCACFRKNKPTCNRKKGCISKERVNDGKFDCDDGGDEEYIYSLVRYQCGACPVSVMRIKNETFCRSPYCDRTTCFSVPSLKCSTYECNDIDITCTSNCTEYNEPNDCKTVMQCSDQTTILNFNFCNGRPDCDDLSDEITNRPGFKCPAEASPLTCVLPQWNLYDNVAQCHDRSDLCFDEDGSFHCFRCLDKRLIISSRQVCDGVIDCYDLSDECRCKEANLSICSDVLDTTEPDMVPCYKNISDISRLKVASVATDTVCDGIAQCENGADEEYCSKRIPTIKCESKWGAIQAIQCDGRPECKDLKDECHSSCKNPPTFCNDTCHSFYEIGDRYCDGYIDEAWKVLNDDNCPPGFDELDCPKRFNCTAGRKVSIDILQVCNGVVDCDNGSDEKNCTDRYYCDAEINDLISIPIRFYRDGKKDCKDDSDEIPSSSHKMLSSFKNAELIWFIALCVMSENIYMW